MSWLFGMIGKLLKGLGKFVAPFLAPARDKRRVGRAVLWLVHFALVVVLFVLLHAVNGLFGVSRMVAAPWPMLREFMLPTIFVFIYVLLWLGWWLWRTVTFHEIDASCADIENAWRDAMSALDRAGIAPAETPIFLIVGQSARGDSDLFDAARMPLLVNQAPASREAPLHVYANRDAIFVSCRRLSMLGRQARYLDEVEAHIARDSGALDDSRNESLLGDVSDDLMDRLGGGVATLEAVKTTAVKPVHAMPRLLKSRDEVAQMSRRLRRLCQLIVEERTPLCPVNGVVLLVPLAATESEELAFEFGAVARCEMSVIQEALEVRCPWSVAIVGEEAPGFDEFVSRIPKDLLHRRFGRDFPLAPDVDSRKLPEYVDEGVRHEFQVALATAAYKVMDLGDASTTPASRSANERIYSFLSEMHWRAGRFGHITTRALAGLLDGPPLLSGCFLIGAGAQSESRAFARGVLQQLIDNQNYVAWTQDALDQERDDRRLALFGYLATATLIVVLTAIWWSSR